MKASEALHSQQLPGLTSVEHLTNTRVSSAMSHTKLSSIISCIITADQSSMKSVSANLGVRRCASRMSKQPTFSFVVSRHSLKKFTHLHHHSSSVREQHSEIVAVKEKTAEKTAIHSLLNTSRKSNNQTEDSSVCCKHGWSCRVQENTEAKHDGNAEGGCHTFRRSDLKPYSLRREVNGHPRECPRRPKQISNVFLLKTGGAS